MLKRGVFYPYLFIFYLVLNPLLHNLDQLAPVQALRPLLALLIVAGVGGYLVHHLFGDWQYAGYLVFLGLVFFFVYGHLNRLIQDWASAAGSPAFQALLLAGWSLLLGALGLRRVWVRTNARRWATPFLNVVCLAALLTAALQAPLALGTELAPGEEPAASGEALPPTGETLRLDCSASPDIYYIVLDGYARADVLEQLYGLDNSPFLDFLAEKGFYVAGQSYADYTQTVFSIPAALNFHYIDPPESEAEGLDYFTGLIAENRLAHLLEGCGYETVAFESGFYFTNHPQVDLHLSHSGGLNEFESLLLADSPLELLSGEASEFSYPAHRERVTFTFEELAKLPERPGPKFVFAHILSPHPPFVFTAGGEPVDPDQPYSINDGDDYDGKWEEYARGYPQQVQFVNRMLQETIEAILERSSQPPVIILQGDHGPGGLLDWDAPERSCLRERTAILNAYYLPGQGSQKLYSSISPVNTFRVVLNAYFGARLKLLKDHTYFTSHHLPGQAIDITRTRSSWENCTPPAPR